MEQESETERTVFLSTVPPSRRERQFAWAVALISFAIFLTIVPFAKVQLREEWAFIPSYQAALMVSDLFTAALIVAQFLFLRSRSLLVLAAGYLFSAATAAMHALSYPRVFAPEGVLSAGPQTTAWLYMAWHAGYPVAAIAYVWLGKAPPVRAPGRAIVVALLAVGALVYGITIATTIGHAFLPRIMNDDRYAPGLIWVVGVVWALNLAALLALWFRRPHSALDVWLMVVAWAWVLDMGLGAVLNAGRFDLGFYAGRIYGLLASSLVLVVLLVETGALYARSARSLAAENRTNRAQLEALQAELIHVSRLTELGQMVSALAHEVNQPLTAMGTYLRGGRLLMQSGDTVRAEDALDKAAEQVTRANNVIRRLRQFAKKSDPERLPADAGSMIRDAAALALIGPEGRAVRLQIRLERDTPRLLIDKVQIQQVLVNLIRNAAEAMQAGPRREILVRVGAPVDGMVEVSVADTGPGLDPDVRDKLFQPFVTTKAAGMGVGLSICRAIVESHGGRIWVTDGAEGGTTFHFTLPVSEAAHTGTTA
jgi:two-component system sensor histidine kinase/response regulator